MSKSLGAGRGRGREGVAEAVQIHDTEFIISEKVPFPCCCFTLGTSLIWKTLVCPGIKTLLKLWRDLDESKQHEKLSSWFFIMFGYTINKDFSTENPQQYHIYQNQHSNINAINNKTVIIILHLHMKSLWAFVR